MRLLRHLLLLGALLAACSTRAPAADGRLVLEVDGEAVTVLRDRFGVPHVFAASPRGVYFGSGYAVAQDRLAQMEAYRRSARGEMAELVGSSAVRSDISTRRGGYTEAERQAQFDRATPEMRDTIRAYADGVNRYLAEIEKSGYPPTVAALGLRLRPWRPTDTIAIGTMMARRFGGDDGGELRNLEVLGMLELLYGEKARAIINDLIWKNDPTAPTTIPAEESPRAPRPPRAEAPAALPPGQRALVPRTPAEVAEVASARAAASREDELRFAETHGLPTRWGSYAIAIRPERTAGDAAMLVGGPQMGFRTPQIAHEIHLVAPGLDVIGMGFAGIPSVLIGHNQHLAWSTTTGVGDIVDTYVEELNPENAEEYRFNGEWRAMEKRTETIHVRGEAPREETYYRTTHGPVIRIDAAKNQAFSVRSSYWNEDTGALEAILGFNRARNLTEFAAQIPRIVSSHNWLVATQDGDIGYWFAGRFPRRPAGADWRFPVPGTGEYEWQGFLTPEELPHIVNPRQGFLANWNNKPAVWWDQSDTPAWGHLFRIGHVNDLLIAEERMDVPKLRAILMNMGSYFSEAEALVPRLLRALEGAQLDETGRLARRYLQGWDYRAHDRSVPAQIYETYLTELREVIFDEFQLLGESDAKEKALSPSVIERALQGGRAALPLEFDYLGKLSPEAAERTAFRNTVARLIERRGPQVSAWGYRQGEIRFAPLPGIPRYSRGTYIQIVELGQPRVRGISILPPGQSEEPASPHYDDQRELAGYWRFKQMQTDRARLEAIADAAGDPPDGED